MMEKFKKGEKTIDFVKDKSFTELSKVPLGQVKLESNSLNDYEARGIIFGMFPSFYRPKYKVSFWYRPFEVLRNVVKGKPSKLKLRKFTKKEKKAMREEFERDIIPQLNYEDKIKYTKEFEAWLNR